MPSLNLEALDTLFFKDGKPFGMGEESWARGVFPPFPTVPYGMLRSIWFAHNLEELSKAASDNDPTAQLLLKKYLPLLQEDDLEPELAFPVPADLYGNKREEKEPAKLMSFNSKPSELISDFDKNHLLQIDAHIKVGELSGKALLKQDVFNSYLSGSNGPFEYHRISDYTSEDHKVGIGREISTRTTVKSKLYRVAMKRLEGEIKNESDSQEKERQIKRMGFYLEFEELSDNGNGFWQSGISRMGAEGKAIAYQNKTLTTPNLPDIDGSQFKIYLATPAVFADGIFPDNSGLELLAAAVGRVQHIGGFDIQNRRPKQMRKAVPAGSVFYVEAKKGVDSTEIMEKLHGQSIYRLLPNGDPFRMEYEKQGFGHCYVGKIKVNG